MRPIRAVLAAVTIVAGCAGESYDPPRSAIVPIRSAWLPSAVVLGGGGETDLVALGWVDSTHASGTVGYRATLRLFRYEPALPDDLVDLGDVFLGVDTLYSRIEQVAVAGDRVTVTMNANLWPVAWVALVTVDGETPVLEAVLEIEGTVDHATRDGRWCVLAAGHEIILLDVADVAAPRAVASLIAESMVTSIAATPGSFLAFTSGGYVHVQPDADPPGLVEVRDPVVRGFRSVYTQGAEAVAAGPALLMGKSRVARLDLRSPGSPVLLRSEDFEGDHGAFANDGHGTSLLEIEGEPGSGLHEAYVVREDASGFSGIPVSLPQWWGSPYHLAAHRERLYALDGGFTIYSMARR